VDEDQATENDALSQIVGELLTQFPTVPPEVVADHVRRAHAAMQSAPVQNYLLVLVERQARLSLTTAARAGASTGFDADEDHGPA
jgi:hypothetical protein